MAANAASAAQKAAEAEAVRRALRAERTRKAKSPAKAAYPGGQGRPIGGRSPPRSRENFTGTPSWALFEDFETQTSGILVGSPLPPPPPGGREWAKHFSANQLDDEAKHLDELRARLCTYLEGVSPQGMVYVIDLVLSQAHEIWRLKKALEAVEVERGAPSGKDKIAQGMVEAETEIGTEWRNMAHSLAETNAQLEAEAERLGLMVHDANQRALQQDVYFEEIEGEMKHVGGQMAELRRRERSLEEQVAAQKGKPGDIAVLRTECSDLSDEVRSLKKDKTNASSEAWSMRLTESALRQECNQLKQEVVNVNEGLARRVAFERMQAQDVQRSLQSGPGLGAGGAFSTAAASVGSWGGRLLFGEDDTSSKLPRDAGALFDAFASTGGGQAALLFIVRSLRGACGGARIGFPAPCRQLESTWGQPITAALTVETFVDILPAEIQSRMYRDKGAKEGTAATESIEENLSGTIQREPLLGIVSQIGVRLTGTCSCSHLMYYWPPHSRLELLDHDLANFIVLAQR